MRSKTILPVVFVLVFSNAWAQSDTIASQPRPFVALHAGALFPQIGQEAYGTATIMSGIRFDRLSVAVGVGYDRYDDWQTIPVFAGLGWDVIKRGANAFYFHTNVGWSKAWNTFSPEASPEVQDDGGHFIHPLIGYRFSEGKIRLYFSAGYKLQRIHYQWQNWGWWPVKTSVMRDIQRISLQMGIGIN